MKPGRSGTGRAVSRDAWPTSGAQRDWLVYCDRVRLDNGLPGLRKLAGEMNLTSATRVSDLLRGKALPVNDDQAQRLLRALGATDPEIAKGVRLYSAARAERDRAAEDAGPPAWWLQSGYVGQVGDIAPLELLGRESELDELAAWCASGDDTYAWWQAGPLAGKSALMAWLVLNPPPWTWVVSFFVTARLAGQADSTAFTDSLLDQLAAVTGEQVPPITLAAARDGLRRQLLERAAAQAVKAGRRLVLVIDGLDEDCGSLPGSGLASIAACLPKRPPAGLRVIVAGRPDPPVPADVDDDHPLRRCRVRRLDVSPHATQVSKLAQRELDEVLATDMRRHDGLGYEVLGLVTACGGGLDRRDLQELTDRPTFEIDRLLRGVFGRTIAGRVGPDAKARVFLFTHETLREQAIDRLGPSTLAAFAERLHAWAAGYRRRGWPTHTPSYLLRSYPRMLADAGDLDGLVALTTDPARHHRMLDVTGGDAAALAEITAAVVLVSTSNSPDLLAALRLAWYRDQLSARNTYIPTHLPAVWATLGQPTRAEALARSITNKYAQAEALISVAEAEARAGNHNHAKTLTAAAEEAARSITDQYAQTEALASVAEGAARAGDYDRAETVAWSLPNSYECGEAVISVAQAAAHAGNHDRAEYFALCVFNARKRAQCLASAAKAAAHAGNYHHASALTAEAEETARSITDPYERAQALASAAKAAAHAGNYHHASALTAEAEETAARPTTSLWAQTEALVSVAEAGACADNHNHASAMTAAAEQAARSITHPGVRDSALTSAAAAAARAGDYDRAEALAQSIASLFEQAEALTSTAEEAARCGDYDRAEAFARAIPNPYDEEQANSYQQGQALTRVAAAAAYAGHYDRAEQVVRAIIEPSERTQALTSVAEAAAYAGDNDRATALAAEAEQVAWAITDEHEQIRALTSMAEATAYAGDNDRAEALARTITNSYEQDRALASVAEAAARAGNYDRAERIAQSITNVHDQDHALNSAAEAIANAGDNDRAEALARTITTPYWQYRALVSVASAAARLGDYDRAERIAQSITEPSERARALSCTAEAAAHAGNSGHADVLAAEAERIARSITSYGQSQALACVAEAAARAGDYDRAERIAKAITEARERTQTLTRVAEAAAHAGNHDRAEALAQSITQLYERGQVLASAAKAAAHIGDRERAERVARSITNMHLQKQALAWVAAEAAARAGDHYHAEALAQSITNPDEQAQALSNLARVTEPARSRSCLAAALAVGRWTIPLKALAALEPSTISTFADMQLRLHS